MNYAIETNGLSKFYGEVARSRCGIDLRVGTGEIYGFLALTGRKDDDHPGIIRNDPPE